MQRQDVEFEARVLNITECQNAGLETRSSTPIEVGHQSIAPGDRALSHDILWQIHHEDWRFASNGLSNSRSATTSSSTFPFSIWWRGEKDTWWLSKTTKEEFRSRFFRWQRLPPPEGSNLFIDGGEEAKPTSIQISNPEIFSSTEMARCQSPMPYVLSHHSTRYEGTPVTSFKESKRSARQLSASCTISKQIQKIHINVPDLSLPTSIKSSPRLGSLTPALLSWLFFDKFREVEEREHL